MELKSRRIKIGNSVWKVKLKDKVNGDNNEYWLGASNPLYKVIEISTKYPNDKDIEYTNKLETYYHEIMHSIFSEGQYFDEEKSEPLVEWVAKCLAQLKLQDAI